MRPRASSPQPWLDMSLNSHLPLLGPRESIAWSDPEFGASVVVERDPECGAGMAFPTFWMRLRGASDTYPGAVRRPAEDGTVGWWLTRSYVPVVDTEQYAIDGLDDDDFGDADLLSDVLDDAPDLARELATKIRARGNA
jgi:hypothetical protein